jgi:hypothetical protein
MFPKKKGRRKEEREGARSESIELPANWNGITAMAVQNQERHQRHFVLSVVRHN